MAADQVEGAATTKLDESDCWGAESVVEFFWLSRFDDGWKIAAGQRHGAPGARERLLDEG